MKLKKMPIDVLLPVHRLLQPYCPDLSPETLVDAIEKYKSENSQSVKSERWYSQNETCNLFQFSRPTLLKLRKYGKLHGTRVGMRKIMFSHSELERFKTDNEEVLGSDGHIQEGEG